MITRPYRKMAAYFVLAIFLLSVDRYLKYLAITNQELSFPLLSNIFSFGFAPNYFIAFSIPLGGMLLNFILAAVIITLLIVLGASIKQKEFSTAMCLSFLLLGAISNFYDRLVHGYVIDYLDLEYFTVFNIADSMIVISVFFLILYIMREERSKKETK